MRRLRTRDPLYRVACRICQHLDALRGGSRPAEVLIQWVAYVSEAQQTLDRIYQRIALARGRGWYLAAAKLHEDLFFQAQRLQGGVEQLLALRTQPDSTVPPSIPLLLEELGQLGQEFDEVEVQVDKGRVVAKTDRLVLEGVDLGQFGIELHLGRLTDGPDSSCFDCVALHPNPSHSGQA